FVHPARVSTVAAAAIATATARGTRVMPSPESHAEVGRDGTRREGTAVVGGEAEGPHEGRARAELTGDALGRGGETGGERAIHDLTDRTQQQFTGACEMAAHDEARGIEDARDVRGGDADVRSRLGDGADADVVARHGAHDDVTELETGVP